MAKANSIPPASQTTYRTLSIRIQTVINSPKAQKANSAILERLPTDRPEDWDHLLQEISDYENLTIVHRGEGAVQICWNIPKNY